MSVKRKRNNETVRAKVKRIMRAYAELITATVGQGEVR